MDTSSSTSTFDNMAANSGARPSHLYVKPRVHFEVPMFDIRLIYARTNRVGANLYLDPSNHFVVRIEDGPQNPLPFEMFMFIGDRYVSQTSTMFLITPAYKITNAEGVVMQTKATFKPKGKGVAPEYTKVGRAKSNFF